MSRLRFHPPPWSVIALIPTLALLCALGTWQVHRGEQKRALLNALSAPESATALELSGRTPPPVGVQAPRATARGAYDRERLMLLDNQSHERRPGYHVWSPLELEDGTWLIVNRGWAVQNPDRRQLPLFPPPAGAQLLSGHWRPLPRPGLELSVNNCIGDTWPRVLQYPTAQDLSCILDAPVADGILLLDSAEADGLVRDWGLPPALPPERHYAYAAQWYTFAATLLAIFVILNLKRQPP